MAQGDEPRHRRPPFLGYGVSDLLRFEEPLRLVNPALPVLDDVGDLANAIRFWSAQVRYERENPPLPTLTAPGDLGSILPLILGIDSVSIDKPFIIDIIEFDRDEGTRSRYTVSVEPGRNDEKGNEQAPRLSSTNTYEMASELRHMSARQLCFLAQRRPISRVDNYARFSLPKATGGYRPIAASKSPLLEVQRWIKLHLLDILPTHTAACAYVSGKSIVDCARPHQAQRVVIRIDLKDFFGSISFPAVRSVFAGLGYNGGMSTVLALLCMDDARIVRDGTFVPTTTLHLPQGAPTSPSLSNLYFREIDELISGKASDLGFAYTRYSDDLFFSTGAQNGGPNEIDRRCARLIGGVRSYLRKHRIRINQSKLRIMRAQRRQVVVGLLVNGEMTLTREKKRKYRATIHWCEEYGLKYYMQSYVSGMWSFIHMVDKAYAQKLRMQHPWIAGSNDESKRDISVADRSRIDFNRVAAYVNDRIGLVFTNNLPPPQEFRERGITRQVKLGWVAKQGRAVALDWEEFVQESRTISHQHILSALALRFGSEVRGAIFTTEDASVGDDVTCASEQSPSAPSGAGGLSDYDFDDLIPF